MTKTNRFFAMAMALTMAASAVSSFSAFAGEVTDDPEAIAPTEPFVASAGESHTGYTQTDLDVIAEADAAGDVDVALYGGDAEEVEGNIQRITKKESDPKIYVEVEWEELKFVYDFGDITKYEWDVMDITYNEVRTYVNGKGPDWVDNDARIKFINHSNRDVWTGVAFEKNPETSVYDDVTVSFDVQEVLLPTAVCTEKLPSEIITMTVEGAPLDCIEKNNAPALGSLKFYISEEARLEQNKTKETVIVEEGEGGHIHHYVYDQFGRLVCTGCKAVKHEYCIDEDEDGLCDECGLERDFCPDCHIGGTCKCI